jgi:hypothetical protein
MPHLKWYDSPHWVKPDEPEPMPTVELPPPLTGRTRHQIIDAIRDDPRYNTINPNNQQHIIDMAIEASRISGTLIEETQGELVNG